MIVANTAIGLTQQFDLTNHAQLIALTEMLQLGTVTALAILHNGNQIVLPRPKRFGHRPIKFGVEVVHDGAQQALGERIWCQAGEVRVSLASTFKGALVRCDVVRTGRQQFDPLNPKRDQV